MFVSTFGPEVEKRDEKTKASWNGQCNLLLLGGLNVIVGDDGVDKVEGIQGTLVKLVNDIEPS